MNRKVHIAIPLSLVFIVIVCQVNAQKNERIGSYYYGGVNWNMVHGSGIKIIDPQLIDPTYPYIDSIRFLPNFSFHSGAALSVKIVNNLNLSFGLEWNLRKTFLKLYGDSITASGEPFPAYNIEHNLSHNLEIPLYLSYNLKRFGIGGGIKVTLLEFRIRKTYSDKKLFSKGFSFAHFPRPLTNKILYPNTYAEYLIISNPEFPLWIRASYESGYNGSSIIYLSLRTII